MSVSQLNDQFGVAGAVRFETVFYDVLARCRDLAWTKRRRFRFNNPLRSLDSTTIDLCAEVFDWAAFRRTKGAVKLHLQLDHRGCPPCWALVTEGARHDVKAAQSLSFAPGRSWRWTGGTTTTGCSAGGPRTGCSL